MAHLVIYCQPGARQTRVVGEHDGKPKLQLHAPPVDGAANAELVSFVAQRCGVSRSRVRIVQGHTSRTKRVEVEGVDEAALRAALTVDPS
ncbi:DUF167 domain-containing protein [Tepidimonas sp.]|uniref:DUF167 domain-containing protein n=1 Tax=Tepidimonas sp. TaxID=2002775 RepID=UPI0028CD86C3|nr:DUF167 domain-containing protein [Tepidimonas sp.]MDT7928209.1 DUF167 domain-containing protein [Tepidimonas sp.]